MEIIWSVLNWVSNSEKKKTVWYQQNKKQINSDGYLEQKQ